MRCENSFSLGYLIFFIFWLPPAWYRSLFYWFKNVRLQTFCRAQRMPCEFIRISVHSGKKHFLGGPYQYSRYYIGAGWISRWTRQNLQSQQDQNLEGEQTCQQQLQYTPGTWAEWRRKNRSVCVPEKGLRTAWWGVEKRKEQVDGKAPEGEAIWVGQEVRQGGLPGSWQLLLEGKNYSPTTLTVTHQILPAVKSCSI